MEKNPPRQIQRRGFFRNLVMLQSSGWVWGLGCWALKFREICQGYLPLLVECQNFPKILLNAKVKLFATISAFTCRVYDTLPLKKNFPKTLQVSFCPSHSSCRRLNKAGPKHGLCTVGDFGGKMGRLCIKINSENPFVSF